jgi:hypothetical protein
LRCAAYAQCNRPQGAGAEDAERLAEEVRAIAERPQFAENATIHEALSHAVRFAENARK